MSTASNKAEKIISETNKLDPKSQAIRTHFISTALISGEEGKEITSLTDTEIEILAFGQSCLTK